MIVAVIIAVSPLTRPAFRIIDVDAFQTQIAGGRTYFLYAVKDRGEDHRFCDPSDGALLVEIKYFTGASAARAWVAADISRQRAQ